MLLERRLLDGVSCSHSSPTVMFMSTCTLI